MSLLVLVQTKAHGGQADSQGLKPLVRGYPAHPLPRGPRRRPTKLHGPGRLDIYSGGHTHTAAVTVEVWDGEPPGQESSRWDEQAEADFESTTGEVAVWSMGLGRADDVITLADAGGSWRVRVSCAGRREAAALSEQEGTGEGVEQYLVQFWPATA